MRRRTTMNAPARSETIIASRPRKNSGTTGQSPRTGDTVRSTINLCGPRPPNDSLRELDRVPIEGGLAAGGAEVEGPALVNGAAGRPLRVHHHSADGIFFHGLLERTVPREPCGLSPRIPRGPSGRPRVRKRNDLQRFLDRVGTGESSASIASLARAVDASISSKSRNSSSIS